MFDFSNPFRKKIPGPCPKGGRHDWRNVGRDDAHDKDKFECSKCGKPADAPRGLSPGPMDD